MEKAKFVGIKKDKKGNLHGNIQIEENKKIMSIPKHYLINESLNNQSCEIERPDGQIKKILVEGKELKKTEQKRSRMQSVQQRSSNPSRHSGYSESRVSQQKSLNVTGNSNTPPYSKAPYNFVPLNEDIVESEYTNTSLPPFDIYSKDLHSGTIELEIETVTPLFIGGNSVKEVDDSTKVDFFAPGGKPQIPGSSLRGMVRTMVEITSWSKFKQFDDRTLYYRGLADKSSLSKEYKNNMGGKQKNSIDNYKFLAGYLKKQGFYYSIVPALLDNEGKQFVCRKTRDRNKEFYYEKQNDSKYLVVSGRMDGKKNEWLINGPDLEAKSIPISETDIEAYKNDDNRFKDKRKETEQNVEIDDNDKVDGNLLRMIRISEEKMVPCFYVIWKDSNGKDRVAFGQSAYFRLAYNKSIGEHVTQNIKSNHNDISESLFGSTEFASRVFFEDAHIQGEKDYFIREGSLLQILSSPKPTAFQHYLEQPFGTKTNIKTLKHWNSSGTHIRGYKKYWHKDINNRLHNMIGNINGNIGEEQKKLSKSQYISFLPVKKGICFKARIRFDNLSDVELGALLFVLSLPENHYHKLGRGKPLGMGSIKITPTLYLINRKERYQKLFDSDFTQWNTAKDLKSKNSFIIKFEEYVLEKTGHSNNNSTKKLWDTDRLKELSALLNWENTNIDDWLNKVNYLELTSSSFSNRNVLPKATEMITGAVEIKSKER